MSRLQFITAIPLDVCRGSGCYVGTRTLVEALRQLGVDVPIITPRVRTPIYTVTRILFNETLRWQKFDGDATIGIDADGYAIADQRNGLPHVACIKGVLGDAVPFETGATRASMALQARLEARHARRAGLVITPSHYCAKRLAELYGVKKAIVVPELIDLEAWRSLFRVNAAAPDPRKFTVFSICRFYPRKRLDVLLQAAALLRGRIPELAIRIAGNGPELKRLEQICSELGLEGTVRWLGDVSMNELASEYSRADIFSLPSVQEGFGIVFLEAMAAGKPIVAARAAAVPEVVRNGLLVEPGNAEALADAILRLYRDPDLRATLGKAGSQHVEEFAMLRVARQFLREVGRVVPALEVAKGPEAEHAN
jgi:glycosyltransferase involved in cell wall biosynthesis